MRDEHGSASQSGPTHRPQRPVPGLRTARDAARTADTVQDVARSARSLTSGGPVTARGLLALQRTAGNSAAVRALQRARAADEPPGTPRPDAGVHDVLRSPGRPLDPRLRGEMESRLGADFSDVTVHTGTAARSSAREIGARAYTSGDHVVLGEGGSDPHTLAHELVHVIQQRRGPVAGADTGTGLRLSDPGDRFEREAERVARAALAPAVPSPVLADTAVSRATRPAGHAAPVQRRVRAQVIARDEGGEVRVEDLVTAGRPDSPHPGGTEGDHTTAFVVLTQAVKRAITGKDAVSAGAEIRRLHQEARKLPGAGLVGNLPRDGKHRRLLDEASAELAELDGELDRGADGGWDMVRLQSLISAYLQYRGLLPLSTLNTKSTKQGTFGKGTGESHRTAGLSRYANGEDVAEEELRDEVLALMDHKGIVRFAAEEDAGKAATMAPGTRGDESSEARLDTIVRQHVDSVEHAYPGVVEAAWGSSDEAVNALVGELRRRTQERAEDEVDDAREQIIRLRKAYPRNDELIEAYADVLRSHGQEPPEEEQEVLGRGARRAVRTAKELIRSPKKLGKSLADKAKKLTAHGAKGRTARDDAHDGGGQPASDRAEGARGTTTAKEPRSKIATQLLIDDGGKITAVLSGGRAASPFSGTQGAHTTAWVVHLDVVRARLKGKDVSAAIAELPALVTHVRDTQERLEGISPEESEIAEELEALSLTADAAAAPRGGMDARRQALTERAEREMDRLVAAAQEARKEGRPTDVLALALQQAVGAVLERVNVIPGITRAGGSKDGAAEGSHRGVLLATGRTPEEYAEALFGMLDIKENEPAENRELLMANHLAMVQEAYPRACAAAGLAPGTDPGAALEKYDSARRKGKKKADDDDYA
ncbi:hypothetical protein AQ490_13850 [Wenjunlia vitaminophila]|uniref:eCIS core domain-containing protein n=1 Tax=Wenjunlia vitaminophila TaxID=76728 RepID=A0A0T6LVS0_WENVI|nr:DUF4157 domain-containing protein [Wenjunlia vitaminophila]KRV50203.1 hypothetical protein AQ490_13850 [Wenjunlia vitaminophila]